MAGRGPRPAVEKRRRTRSRFGSSSSTVNVYVGNLPADATEADLRDVLADRNSGVISVRVPLSTSSDRAVSRFGFIEFRSSADATDAVAHLTRGAIRGRRLRARIATERVPRGGDAPEENTQYEWGGRKTPVVEELVSVNAAPTLAPSGALQAAAAKSGAAGIVNGGQDVYLEPEDAVAPDVTDGWRIFVFKGDDAVDVGTKGGAYYLSGGRCFMLGRDRDVVHIPVDNPSCSKLHAVIQFRSFRDAAGSLRTRPYIFDLDSRNGTFLNQERIDGRRFIELRSKDVLRFGASTRDYVLMSENDSP